MNSKFRKKDTIRLLLPFVLILASYIAAAASVPSFGTLNNLQMILKQASFLAMTSLGLLCILLVGEIDLSIGTQFAFYGVICGFLYANTNSLFLSFALTLLTAIIVGFIIGYTISKLESNGFLLTIGVSAFLTGAIQMLLSKKDILKMPDSFADFINHGVLGISFPIIVMIVVAVLLALFLRYTYFGKYIYAVGSNESAAEKSGISVDKTKMMAFALGSLIAAVSAIVYVGRIGTAGNYASSNLDTNILASVALGGASFNGGYGKVLPVIFGSIFISLLSSILIALNIAFFYQQFIKSAVLIAVIYANNIKK